MRRAAKALSVLVAAVALLGAGVAQAQVVKTQGTWYGTDGTDGTLRGRDINGNAVNLLDGAGTAPNPDLVFVYDTQLQLTWLANWNAGAGSSYDNGPSATDGRMTWQNAVDWAANLTVGSFAGWSLPVVQETFAPGCQVSFAGGTDCGWNVYGSEAGRRGTLPPANTTGSPLAHMYYDTLGNLGIYEPDTGAPVLSGYGLSNTGPFSNMQSSFYWSGTAFAPSARRAWMFYAANGLQGDSLNSLDLYAVAVRPDDVVAVAPVPEPGTYAMLLAGLGAVAAVARRRARDTGHD